MGGGHGTHRSRIVDLCGMGHSTTIMTGARLRRLVRWTLHLASAWLFLQLGVRVYQRDSFAFDGPILEFFATHRLQEITNSNLK